MRSKAGSGLPPCAPRSPWVGTAYVTPSAPSSQVRHVHHVNWHPGGAAPFAVPLYLNTTFVAVLAEGALPAPGWLPRALHACKVRPAVHQCLAAGLFGFAYLE
jgi:hypothetical protein